MKIHLKKIDAIIVVALIIVSGLFLARAGYVSLPFFEDETVSEEDENVTSQPPDVPTPPNSFIPSSGETSLLNDGIKEFGGVGTSGGWDVTFSSSSDTVSSSKKGRDT